MSGPEDPNGYIGVADELVILQSYRVQWSIDIDATDPVQAIREAKAILEDPYSVATVFSARDMKGKVTYADTEFDPPVILGGPPVILEEGL